MPEMGTKAKYILYKSQSQQVSLFICDCLVWMLLFKKANRMFKTPTGDLRKVLSSI